jgi:hypothetical protein
MCLSVQSQAYLAVSTLSIHYNGESVSLDLISFHKEFFASSFLVWSARTFATAWSDICAEYICLLLLEMSKNTPYLLYHHQVNPLSY